jgi:integrase
MAWIEARKAPTGHTSHRVMWRQGERKQSETFASRAEALRFQADVIGSGERWPDGWIRGLGYSPVPEAERIAGPALPIDQRSPTLLAEAIAYTASKHTKAGPEHRMKMRRDFERHLAGELGDTPIDEVTRAQIQEWLDDQAERYTFKTIKTRRASLSAVFRVWVYEHGGSNPVDGTRNDGTIESKVEPVFLAAWEVDAIVEQLAGDPHHGGVYVETLVGTGMRKGEALALRVGDLDLRAEHPAIRISKARKHGHDGVHRIGTTKTRSSRRTVTIDPDLTALLRGFTEGRAPAETLFDLGNEATWQRNNWVPALRAAQLANNPRVHDLRHTHASWLLADGMPLFAVSKRLGHSDIQTTANIYGHLDRSTDIAAAASISRVRRPEARPPLRAV